MNYGERVTEQRVVIADQRATVRRYLANTHALDAVLSEVSEGVKLSVIADRLNVPYQALYSVLSGSYRDQYRAARAAFAELLAEKNLDMADKVERMQLPTDVAKTAAGLRHWHMERTASEQWGQKSSIDVTHKGVVGLHLDAIRQLSREPLEGEFVEVSDEEDGVGDDSRAGGDMGGVDDVGGAVDGGGGDDSENDPVLSEVDDETVDDIPAGEDWIEHHPLL